MARLLGSGMSPEALASDTDRSDREYIANKQRRARLTREAEERLQGLLEEGKEISRADALDFVVSGLGERLTESEDQMIRKIVDKHVT